MIVSFLVFSICMAILNLNKFESTYYVRLFLQIDTIINILIKTKIFYGNMITTDPFLAKFADNVNNTIFNVNGTNYTKNIDLNYPINITTFNDSFSCNSLHINDTFNQLANLTNNLLFQNTLTDNKNFQGNIHSIS